MHLGMTISRDRSPVTDDEIIHAKKLTSYIYVPYGSSGRVYSGHYGNGVKTQAAAAESD